MSFLEINELAIGYQSALMNNINLQANDGQLIGIIGANGVGKSTLLKTIARILKKKFGSILVESADFFSFSPQVYAKKIGFSAFSNIFVSNLTVYDIVRLGRIPHTPLLGFLDQQDRQIIDQAIEQTGLQKIANKELSKISDGQRQRAFIARLLAQQSKLMIFDEPTAFLDIEGKIKITSLFRNIVKQSDKIIIFSTHDVNLAIQFCDKIWLLTPNSIFDAAPEDLILQNHFQELFPNSNIAFNNFTADFYVSKQPVNTIAILNNSTQLRLTWTSKSLVRIGFEIDKNSTNKLIINDDNWQILFKNYNYEAKSIEHLQQILEQH